MYEVIVFGTGNLSKFLTQILDYSKVKINAYLDNDKEKWGAYINNVPVKSISNLNGLYYDFILIASQYDNEIYEQLLTYKVDKNKIFHCSIYINNTPNYLEKKIREFTNSKDKHEMIITGISYSMLGINPLALNVKGYSFANGSQDLYYDYNIVKFIIERFILLSKSIKYCLIGISYYSFQYDLSLSSMKFKILQYYETLGDVHNYKEYIDNYEVINISKNIAEKILNISTNTHNDESLKKIQYEHKVVLGKKISEKDCNKDYPQTVKENKQIFKDYLKLLKDNNIKPIVVVFPASKYYTNYFSKRIEDEFHSIINEVKKEYDFQYIDYFRSELFDDEDFQDVSHLNSRGAEKFTNILNDIIEW